MRQRQDVSRKQRCYPGAHAACLCLIGRVPDPGQEGPRMTAALSGQNRACGAWEPLLLWFCPFILKAGIVLPEERTPTMYVLTFRKRLYTLSQIQKRPPPHLEEKAGTVPRYPRCQSPISLQSPPAPPQNLISDPSIWKVLLLSLVPDHNQQSISNQTDQSVKAKQSRKTTVKERGGKRVAGGDLNSH